MLAGTGIGTTGIYNTASIGGTALALSANSTVGNVDIHHTGSVALVGVNGTDNKSSFTLTTDQDASGNAAITVGSGSGGTLSLSGGTINLSTNLLQATGGNNDLTIGTATTAATLNGNVVNLTANDGQIQNGIAGSTIVTGGGATSSLTLTTTGGNIGNGLLGGTGAIATDATTLTVNPGSTISGDATIVDTNNSITLNASKANSLNLVAGTNGTGKVSTAGDLSFNTAIPAAVGGNAFTLAANEFDVNNTVSAYQINVTGTGALLIGGNGAGVLSASDLDSGANTTAKPIATGINLTVVQTNGTAIAPNAITFASNISLVTGDGTTDSGTVNLNAISTNNGTAVIVNTGVNVTANGVVEINTCDLQLNGTITATYRQLQLPVCSRHHRQLQRQR